MKTQFIIAATACLGYSLADDTTTESPDGRYFVRVRDRIEERLPNYFNKTLNGGVPRSLYRYGCYCFPGKSENIPGNENMNNPKPRNNYRGPPVDEIDRLCMQLWQAEQCMEKDWQANGQDNCNLIEPKWGMNYWYEENADGSSNCDQSNHRFYKHKVRQNVDGCMEDACNVETLFIQEFLALMDSGYQFSKQYMWNNDEKYDTTCPKKTDFNGPPLKEFNTCCGTGLKRKLFNSAYSECCNDKIVPFGSC